MRLPGPFLFALAFLCLALSSSTPAQQALTVRMQLTKTTILLGEPDWVDVSVTNDSDKPLIVDMGADCFGQKPLIVKVPDAEPSVAQPRLCSGGYAGSCASGLPPQLDPGETFTRRYVLSGDFRIVRPGRYNVVLEQPIRYGLGPLPSTARTLVELSSEQTAKLTVTLVVLPAAPARLLALEQDLAQQATA